ncbi:uncharacterized protein LACBIDRAFT_314115 [Laccaria bicolor S238N-H82]|uniref:Predicted protein n=1 Tax=Laccaria bicolor (strain S238N-H82 / ATCC MYA-4686) TaxID=486041 RepID=B0D1M3_LACBS|nr:uncharacterized protein LACBIDRAFT_314115 [Laccaria bicolor S238N-H82]EDR12017.1 predicted protein [Laccaria bicolor S238N-H82]|eukprot:XP_001877914.1 predicted protein [Laccaria bicolor S238N-H82]
MLPSFSSWCFCCCARVHWQVDQRHNQCVCSPQACRTAGGDIPACSLPPDGTFISTVGDSSDGRCCPLALARCSLYWQYARLFCTFVHDCHHMSLDSPCFPTTAAALISSSGGRGGFSRVCLCMSNSPFFTLLSIDGRVKILWDRLVGIHKNDAECCICLKVISSTVWVF